MPDRDELLRLAEHTPADRLAASKAFDIAFRGDTENIDEDMAGLFAAHRKDAQADLLGALGYARNLTGPDEIIDAAIAKARAHTEQNND